MLEDVLALLEELLVQLVDECLERVCSQLLEVDDVEKLVFQPLLVLVLILDEIIIQLLLYVGEYVQELIKVVLRNHADGRVVARLNRSCALRASEEGDLTEVLAWV